MKQCRVTEVVVKGKTKASGGKKSVEKKQKNWSVPPSFRQKSKQKKGRGVRDLKIPGQTSRSRNGGETKMNHWTGFDEGPDIHLLKREEGVRTKTPLTGGKLRGGA